MQLFDLHNTQVVQPGMTSICVLRYSTSDLNFHLGGSHMTFGRGKLVGCGLLG